MVGAEAAGFVEFALAGGEGGDFAAHGGGEFDGHVAEAADAHDADAAGGAGERGERIEDGDAAAEERAGFGGGEPVWDRQGPGPMGAEPAGESAAVADDRGFGGGAEVLFAANALGTVHARAAVPADADALADGDAFGRVLLGRRTEGDDAADRLVAEHGGVG